MPRCAALVASLPAVVLGEAEPAMFSIAAASGRCWPQVNYKRPKELFVIEVWVRLGLGMSGGRGLCRAAEYLHYVMGWSLRQVANFSRVLPTGTVAF